MMTTPTGKPRGRPKGCVKTGGRVAGGKSLDRGQRQLVSAELAGSIMTTFEGLGGTAAMLAWATDNKTTFYTQILSRLFPAPQKDEPDIQINQQFNANLSDTEAARRIAFVLASACHDDPTVAVRDVTPVEVTPQEAFVNPLRWTPPTDFPDMPEPPSYQPVDDPQRAQWLEELPLTDEQRRDNALIRETLGSLSDYRGNTAEQGGTVRSPRNVERDPRAAQRDRMIAAHRRNKLL